MGKKQKTGEVQEHMGDRSREINILKEPKGNARNQNEVIGRSDTGEERNDFEDK